MVLYSVQFILTLLLSSVAHAIELSIQSISTDSIVDFTFEVSYLQRDALQYIDYVPTEIFERLQNLINYSQNQQIGGAAVPSTDMLAEANDLMMILAGIAVPGAQSADIEADQSEGDIVIQDTWQTDQPNFYAPQSGLSLEQGLANIAGTNLQDPFANVFQSGTSDYDTRPVMSDPQSYTGMNYFNDPNFFPNVNSADAFRNTLNWLNSKPSQRTNDYGTAGQGLSDIDLLGQGLSDLDFQNAMVLSRGGSMDGQQQADAGNMGGFGSPRAANIDIIDMASNMYQTPPRTQGTSMQISPEGAMQISPEGGMQISPQGPMISPESGMQTSPPQNNANGASGTGATMAIEEEEKTNTITTGNTGGSNVYLSGTRGWPNVLAGYNLPNGGNQGQGGTQRRRVRRSGDTNDMPTLNGKRPSPFIG